MLGLTALRTTRHELCKVYGGQDSQQRNSGIAIDLSYGISIAVKTPKPDSNSAKAVDFGQEINKSEQTKPPNYCCLLVALIEIAA